MQRTARLLTVPTALLGLAGLPLLLPAAAGAQGRPPAAAAAPSGPQASKPFVKNLKAIDELIRGKEFDKALALIEKTDAMPDKTPGDQFYIDNFKGSALLQLSRLPEAAAAFEKVLASNLLPPDQATPTLGLVAKINAGVDPRDWAKAADYGSRYLEASGNTDAEMLETVAIAHYQAGRPDKCEQTLRYGDLALRTNAAAQAKTQEGVYQVMLRCYAAANDGANTIRVGTELVRNYSKRDYWGALTSNLLRQSEKSDTQTLNVYRLIFALDLLESGSEYLQLAQLARDAGLPGEAETVMRKGIAAGAFANPADKAQAQQLLDDVVRLAGEDRKELPRLEAEAKAARTGEKDLLLGEAFLSYGQADKAIEAIRRGIGKGVKNADEANLLLGKALLKAGNGADAAAAFAKVTGPEFGQLGTLWSILAREGLPTA